MKKPEHSPRDVHERPLKDLRVSVTDRCNYRCTYCMPLEEYSWLERAEILSFEEIARLARVFVGLGVEKIRLTGGEPLVRKNLEELVSLLSSLEGLKDLSLTTNGAGLASRAKDLKAAGLQRVNVSLDSLDPERFRRLTKRGNLDDVVDGILAARAAGLDPVKINAVILRGVNEDEIVGLIEFGRKHGCQLRFIEYMDVGNANSWSFQATVPKRQILERIRARFPLREVGRDEGRAPAVEYELEDGSARIGMIGSVTEPFCSSCTRARITADGKLVTCLFAREGHDLKTPLREGASDAELTEAIRSLWADRRDRFSVERLETLLSEAGYRPEDHEKFEMITLGG